MGGVLLLIIALVGGFVLAYKTASQVSKASVKLGGWSSVLAGIAFVLVFFTSAFAGFYGCVAVMTQGL